MIRRIGLAGAMVLVMGLSVLGQTATAQEDAKALVDKAIKALGGEEPLSKIKAVSYKVKGTISFGENENEFTSLTVLQGYDHSR